MTEMIPNYAADSRVLAAMMPRAVDLALSSGGNMRTMAIRPEDTENFPGQSGAVVMGTPIPVEGVRYIAGTVVPTFDALTDNIRDRSPATLARIGKILTAGENVILVTSHSNLIDPEFALAAVSNPLREAGYKFKMGISLGKMLSLLEHKVDLGDGEVQYVPMVKVVQMQCDETYLSIPPKSESVKKGSLRKKMPETIDEQNEQAREAMLRGLDRGGMLLSMASSGTTHKLIAAKEHLLGRVSGGTADIMAHEKTHVVTVAMDIDSEDTFIDLICEPEKLTTREEVDVKMTDLASWLTSKASDGKRVLYETAEQAAEKAAEKVKRAKK